ncbi:HPF/RaiA family ribosome-associated protein [Belliella pelovolcani]|jgi:ribosomal subunit interface protein|uniref:SSU ribosomal protein S30P /sigma 54 modulation protein n=1 Tax=Belliella pelovolcani TaxID=529505 RepID=A0A1N7PYX5_9BACT|nr:HPF/RaiA family ribosome-associated protein [Belliella pelovolcani]SIT15800.1 SSU ribosomal protein S30P /sigma 54 modulation protein [Belliella pelovolcani]
MNYTENYKGVKIDVQSPNLDVSESVQAEIRASIDKLSRFTSNINALDVYFKAEGQGGTATTTIGMRVGVPGPDVFAEEKGENWIGMLKSVTDKNIRQLQKDK